VSTAVCSGLFTGNMEQNKWQGAFYRFLFTLMTTFWLIFVRIFLVRFSVMPSCRNKAA
jgi:hypothetical protein